MAKNSDSQVAIDKGAYKGGVTNPEEVGRVVADLLKEDKDLKRFADTVKLRRGQHYHKEGLQDVSQG